MARLYLFAEGQTEQTFADTVLRPYLADHGIYLHGAVLVANSHRKHRTHQGGVRKFQAIQKDITRFLKQDSKVDAFFTSMIDLYRLPEDFPGFKEAEKHRSEPYRRVGMLEELWARETGDRRFIPHIQLHEYEAYLFVNVSILSNYYDDRQRDIALLKASADAFDSPELIDDGPETAPSKRIICRLQQYESDKPTVGVQAAERIGLPEIRRKCPHFAQWLERLEGLGTQNAG